MPEPAARQGAGCRLRRQQGAAPRTSILSVHSTSNCFGGVQALLNVSFELQPGEVLALAGDNGVGKLTLIKCISGVHQPDEGEIRYKDERVTMANPREARTLDDLSGPSARRQSRCRRANVFLGREPPRRFLGLLPAIYWQAEVLIMDELTAVLGAPEQRKV